MAPPHWEAQAVRFLTRKLLESPMFVNSVQTAHRKGIELKDSLLRVFLSNGDNTIQDHTPQSQSQAQNYAKYQTHDGHSQNRNPNHERWEREERARGTSDKKKMDEEEESRMRSEELEKMLEELRKGRK